MSRKFSPQRQSVAPSGHAISAALNSFIEVGTWEEARDILVQQQAVLLHPATRMALRSHIDALRTESEESASTVAFLEQCLSILNEAAASGIEEAWRHFETASSLSPALQPILEQLEALRVFEDLPSPAHIELLQEAIRLIAAGEGDPELGASLSGELGESLLRSRQGNRAENVERAIGAYRAALEVFTRESFPDPWAQVYMGLGIAYRGRIRGNKEENLKQAIACFQTALQIYTPEAFPESWATTQRNLGNAYADLGAITRGEYQKQAIVAYEEALQVFTQEAFPDTWAAIQNSIGSVYFEWRGEDREQSLEQALAAYGASLQVYTRDDSPAEWARVQKNLGDAYRDRIAGNPAENVERAISAYEMALQERTEETVPDEWAVIQQELGDLYLQRMRGGRSENVDRSIAAYQAVLRIFTREAKPREWGGLQDRLGTAYLARIMGDEVDNQEHAIIAYENALQVTPREVDPRSWARTQQNLGTAYTQRLEGERAANLAYARSCFRAALQVYTREDFPMDWARTLNSIGILDMAYAKLTAYASEEDIQLAINAFEAALEIFTPERHPGQWAMTQSNLGNAYWAMMQSNPGNACIHDGADRAENLERAISAHEAALQVYTQGDFPREWARTQINLGNAYMDRMTGARTENLERAVNAYEAALQIYTRETLPVDFRGAEWNRALALTELGRWGEVHAAYTSVRAVQRDLLSISLSEADRYASIASVDHSLYLNDAVAILNLPSPNLTEAALVLEEGRAQVMRLVLALDRLDLSSIADAPARNRAESFIAARNAWRAAQRKLGRYEPDITGKVDLLALYELQRAEVQRCYAAFIAERDAIRLYDDPDFLSPSPRWEDIAQAVASQDEALVYLAYHPDTSLALIVSRDGQGEPDLHYIPMPALTTETFKSLTFHSVCHRIQTASGAEEREDFCGGYIWVQMGGVSYLDLQNWGASLGDALAHLPPASGFALALHQLRAEWEDNQRMLALFDTPFAQLPEDTRLYLGEAFATALLQVELERSLGQLGGLGLSTLAGYLQVQGVRKVFIIPYGLLSLLPLPAINVTTPDGQEHRFGELFEVAVIPSANALWTAKQRASALDSLRRPLLVTAGNPQPIVGAKNLPYAEAESNAVQRIAETFEIPAPSIRCLTSVRATRSAVVEGLQQAWFAHLAMHGQYRQDAPRKSCILLAGDASIPEAERIISLDECLTGAVDLKGIRLLILSACETSIVNIQTAPDEMVGMATGFLQSGAAAVIASLWAVDDRATYLLISRFAKLYLDPRRGWSPARCLSEAQRWLREEATNTVLADYDPAAPLALKAGEPLRSTRLAPASTVNTPRKILMERRSLRFTHERAMLEIQDQAERGDPNELPYANPIYWAAFTVMGY